MDRTKDVYKYQPFYNQQYSFHFTVYMQSITMVTTESSRHCLNIPLTQARNVTLSSHLF